jgi:SAM-dependent methyltransferase
MTWKLYGALAPWWPLISSPDEYKAESAFYRKTLMDAADGKVKAVLELGSGGGNNASHLKRHWDLTLVDPSTGMLAVSRELNPECEHVEGDMRSVRLGRTFDAVFVHDAISYMATEEDLRRAIETAYLHTRPGGAALFAPDHVKELFQPRTEHGGTDGEKGSARFLEWTWDPDPSDSTCTVEYAFLLKDERGSVRVVHDRHIEGVFSRALWLRAMKQAGFEATVVPVKPPVEEAGRYEVFVGKRPR